MVRISPFFKQKKPVSFYEPLMLNHINIWNEQYIGGVYLLSSLNATILPFTIMIIISPFTHSVLVHYQHPVIQKKKKLKWFFFLPLWSQLNDLLTCRQSALGVRLYTVPVLYCVSHGSTMELWAPTTPPLPIPCSLLPLWDSGASQSVGYPMLDRWSAAVSTTSSCFVHEEVGYVVLSVLQWNFAPV